MNLISDSSLPLREARLKGYVLYNSLSMHFRKGKTTGKESRLVLTRGGQREGLAIRGPRTCFEVMEPCLDCGGSYLTICVVKVPRTMH